MAWRLIHDWECAPRWNMAVDEAILEAVANGDSPSTVRLYRWDRAAVTVGRFQNVERGVDLDSCRSLRVAVIRRPTGGRGVLHGSDQTVSVAIPQEVLGSDGQSVARSCAALSNPIALALGSLSAVLRMGGSRQTHTGSGDCFSLSTQADMITVQGAKLVGSAQCRRRGVILQQTSIRHHPPAVSPAAVFRGSVAEGIYPFHGVDSDQLARALVDGFTRTFGGDRYTGSLTKAERDRAVFLVDSRTAL